MQNKYERLAQLHDIITQVISESPASDAFELKVASKINASVKTVGGRAKRAGGDVRLPDVAVEIPDVGSSYVEVKMSHSDNLANPRFTFEGGKWLSSYDTPVAKAAITYLESSREAQAFIRDLRSFLGRRNVTLVSTRGAAGDVPGAVTFMEMKKFLNNRGNGWVMQEDNINVGALVRKHYASKMSPAEYIQAGDDFYKLSSTDSLGIDRANKGAIPLASGTGHLKVRVALRYSTKSYEIQAELKLRKMNPEESPFSVLSKNKINPFDALIMQAEKKKQRRSQRSR